MPLHEARISSPRSCYTANAYRDITNRQRRVIALRLELCSAAEATLPILAGRGGSTTMVLVAGRVCGVAGGLEAASGRPAG